MKQKLTKYLPLALSAMFFGNAVNAQEQVTTQSTQASGSNQLSTWSIGVNAGVLSPISPLGGKNDFSNWKSNLGYGLYI